MLPLFPLQLVLFPRTSLPLHIFEERYKRMIADVISQNTEFGIVQAGEKGIVNTGCTATIERVLKRHPDGRLEILTMGRRRFEILLLNEDKDFLRAAVQYYDDEDLEPADKDVQERVLESYRALQRLDNLPEPEWNDPQLSFQLANSVPDLEFKQILLATKSEAERLRQVAEYLPGYIFKQRRLARVRQIAPRNGHAPWPVTPA